MIDAIKVIKNSFIKDLNNEPSFWRIFKRRTLVDLLNVSVIKYYKNYSKSDLIEVINLLIKVKILTLLGEMNISGNLNDLYKRITEEKQQLIELYNEILEKISVKANHYKNYKFYNINNETQYLKIINELNANNFSEESLDDLICATINTLIESN